MSEHETHRRMLAALLRPPALPFSTLDVKLDFATSMASSATRTAMKLTPRFKRPDSVETLHFHFFSLVSLLADFDHAKGALYQ